MRERRYSFVVCKEQKKVICITKYKGKTVKGTAKCMETDVFSEDIGKRIAKAKCQYYVSIKRLDSISNVEAECCKKMEELKKEQEKLEAARRKSICSFSEAAHELCEVIKKYKE